MTQSINTNLMSLNTQRNLASTQGSLSTAMERLSSGLRVNSAKDDAAGLAIANTMTGQIRGMNVAMRNAGDALSFAQTAESGLARVTDMLQRMRELSVQAMNGSLADADRGLLASEFGQLQSEISRTISSTKFNNTAVLATSASVDFQVGPGTAAIDKINVQGVDLTAGAVNTAYTAGSTAIGTQSNAGTALTNIEAALTAVNTQRATFGGIQNRFENVITNLRVSVESQSAARGRIIDADFAQETANLSRSQVLQQAGLAMLSQANAMPNNVLALLR